VNGGCWWFPAEMLSKLNLQDSAGISPTRTFLLCSTASSGHGGHLKSPCGRSGFDA
jgi:hypothetical protein